MATYMTPRSRRNQAFSLIELLVVVSIIAVLASLLLPVISSVRASARSASCLSNMRQMMAGAIAYSQDWRGLLPYREHLNTPGTVLYSHSGYFMVGAATYISEAQGGKNITRDVLRCPADQRPDGSPGPSTYAMEGLDYKQAIWGDMSVGFTSLNTSYGVSDLVLGLGPVISATNRSRPVRATVSNAARATRAVLIDSYLVDVAIGRESSWRPMGQSRHRTGVNMGFGDGHVANFNFAPIPAGACWDLIWGSPSINGYSWAGTYQIGTGNGVAWHATGNSCYEYPWDVMRGQ